MQKSRDLCITTDQKCYREPPIARSLRLQLQKLAADFKSIFWGKAVCASKEPPAVPFSFPYPPMSLPCFAQFDTFGQFRCL